jgi:hypothetical protein
MYSNAKLTYFLKKYAIALKGLALTVESIRMALTYHNIDRKLLLTLSKSISKC